MPRPKAEASFALLLAAEPGCESGAKKRARVPGIGLMGSKCRFCRQRMRPRRWDSFGVPARLDYFGMQLAQLALPRYPSVTSHPTEAGARKLRQNRFAPFTTVLPVFRDGRMRRKCSRYRTLSRRTSADTV
jgi:hypothetical protein